MRRTIRNLPMLSLMATVALLAMVQAVHTAPGYVAAVALNANSGYWPIDGSEMALNPVTNRLYVAGGTTGTVTVVDGESRSVLAEIPIGRNAIRVAVNPLTNRIYAANWDASAWPCCSTVAVIDGDTNTVIANVLANGHPWGLAVDSMTNRIYAANFINVQVIDGVTNTIATAFGAGSNEHAAAVNPVTQRLYIAATFLGVGNVNVFDTTSNAFVGSFAVDLSAFRIRVNTVTNKIYIVQSFPGPEDQVNSLLVVDGATNTIANRITLPAPVYDVAIDETGDRVYATWTDHIRSGISVLDGTTDAVIATVPSVGSVTTLVAVNPLTDRLYVAGSGERTNDNNSCIWELEDGPSTLDQTPPTLSAPSFSVNPKAITDSSLLTAVATDPSGIGQGRFQLVPEGWSSAAFRPMAVSESSVSATIGASFPAGIYTARVQARDGVPCSRWTGFVTSGFFVIYDPDGAFVTGAGSIIPGGSTSDAGDALPGLDNNSRAHFGFVVRYQNGASTTPDGRLDFRYDAGDFTLQSASLDWLVTNTNQVKFQGTATIDGQTGTYSFRVDARDGDAMGGSQPDRFSIKIYAPGVSPENGSPTYRASGDLASGQIVTHSNK